MARPVFGWFCAGGEMEIGHATPQAATKAANQHLIDIANANEPSNKHSILKITQAQS